MIFPNQRQAIIDALVAILKAVEAYRGQVTIDPNDLGTSIDLEVGYQPTLDGPLKKWRSDPVGTALRAGIRQIGELVAPHVTMDELVKIAEEAAQASPNYDVAIGIFNHIWDGVETQDRRVWRA